MLRNSPPLPSNPVKRHRGEPAYSRDPNLTRYGTSAFRKHATFEERTILQLRLWLPAPPFQIY